MLNSLGFRWIRRKYVQRILVLLGFMVFSVLLFLAGMQVVSRFFVTSDDYLTSIAQGLRGMFYWIPVTILLSILIAFAGMKRYKNRGNREVYLGMVYSMIYCLLLLIALIVNYIVG